MYRNKITSARNTQDSNRNHGVVGRRPAPCTDLPLVRQSLLADWTLDSCIPGLRCIHYRRGPSHWPIRSTYSVVILHVLCAHSHVVSFGGRRAAKQEGACEMVWLTGGKKMASFPGLLQHFDTTEYGVLATSISSNPTQNVHQLQPEIGRTYRVHRNTWSCGPRRFCVRVLRRSMGSSRYCPWPNVTETALNTRSASPP